MQNAFLAFAILCALALLALLCWNPAPRRELQRPTVPSNQRLPPA